VTARSLTLQELRERARADASTGSIWDLLLLISHGVRVNIEVDTRH